MKKIIIISAFIISLGSCQKVDFEKAYPDPSKISASTVEKQYTGTLNSIKWYVLPDYWNYFVVIRPTLNRYNQAVGWENADNQYVPGGGLINDRWNTFYGFVAQYREMEKIFKALPPEDQADRRIYAITSTIYFYDQLQKVVDLHGDVPFSAAGMLSTNGGDYNSSLAKYDGAESIYTKMLDDLKGFSDELSTITIKAGISVGFRTQDIVNKGDVMMWRRYCNSLRLRMLTRVSETSSMQARARTEIAEILGNATKFPLVTANTENVQITVFNIDTDIHAKNFRSGLEDWNGNVASKVMIDNMNANKDPRLRVMFEPGVNAKGVYAGLDQMLDLSTQNQLIAGGTLSIYNRSTLSRNQFFPGVIINAAEVSFLIAEYQLKANNAAAAKVAYERGVQQSIEYYYRLRAVTNDNTAPAAAPATAAEIQAYLAANGVNWDRATDKLALIATQKWLHYSVVQPYESWSEIRRLDLPRLTFPADRSNNQSQPPSRWVYPSSELIYNAENYNAVKAKDNLTTKIFWDVK